MELDLVGEPLQPSGRLAERRGDSSEGVEEVASVFELLGDIEALAIVSPDVA